MSGAHIADVDKSGFETSVEVDYEKILRWVVVAALDEDGEVMGMSDVYDMGDEFAKQVDPEDAVADDDGNASKYGNIGYAGAGAAFGGFLVVAGGASLATFMFFRRRRSQSAKRDTKYAPVMMEEHS